MWFRITCPQLVHSTLLHERFTRNNPNSGQSEAEKGPQQESGIAVEGGDSKRKNGGDESKSQNGKQENGGGDQEKSGQKPKTGGRKQQNEDGEQEQNGVGDQQHPNEDGEDGESGDRSTGSSVRQRRSEVNGQASKPEGERSLLRHSDDNNPWSESYQKRRELRQKSGHSPPKIHTPPSLTPRQERQGIPVKVYSQVSMDFSFSFSIVFIQHDTEIGRGRSTFVTPVRELER